MSNTKTIVWVIAFVALVSPPAIYGQNLKAISTLPTDTAVIGQQLPLEISLEVPENTSVDWPLWNDTISAHIEIIRASVLEKTASKANGSTLFKQVLTISSFDSGSHVIPSIPIKYSLPNDTTSQTAYSNPLMLRVFSVAVDTSQAFRPIKGPMRVPITFMEVLPWLLGLAGIALLVFIIMKLVVRRSARLGDILVPQKPSIAPHILALSELEELRLRKMWQSGQVKEYYTRLSEIVRVYIEGQFKVMAVEMTTDEILSGITPFNINAEAIEKLSFALQLADLVKFAKAQPTAMENDLCLNHMVDFVNESYANALPGMEETHTEQEVKQNDIE
ncbi:MAG: hypothetical protein KGZ82_05935 [Bacteroidales bacterium]|nr:hypothetical protein [Bacteroidales bacterium]